MIQCIWEAVLKGLNMSKVLRECQGKDKTSTEWLEGSGWKDKEKPQNVFQDGP